MCNCYNNCYNNHPPMRNRNCFCKNSSNRTIIIPSAGIPGPIGPMGPMGPAGPTGPKGDTGPEGTSPSGLKAYGGLYNESFQSLVISSSGSLVQVEFNKQMPLLNMSIDNNKIVINEPGVYEISYNLDITATDKQSYKAIVRKNSVAIDSSTTTKSATTTSTSGAPYETNLRTNVIETLSNSDELDLVITTTISPSGTTTILGNGGCNLIVKKIDK